MNYIKPISFLACLFFSALVQANIQSHFDQIKNDPNALYAFLKSMPKGGELHYHLAGGPILKSCWKWHLKKITA